MVAHYKGMWLLIMYKEMWLLIDGEVAGDANVLLFVFIVIFGIF